MIPPEKRLVLTILVVGLGLVGFEWHLLRTGRQSLDSLNSELATLESRDKKARASQDEIETALAAAARELAALQATEAAAGTGREAELRAWLKLTNRMRQLFAQHPDQAIPELALLTPLDWLRLAREASLDSEAGVRKSLSAVRTEAKTKAGSRIMDALIRYAETHDDQLPGSAGELSAYLKEPLNPEILPRYGMNASGRRRDLLPPVPAGRMVRADTVAVLVELEPIDADYDTRSYFYATGAFGMMDWNTVEYRDGLREAQIAFARANAGAPPRDIALVLPLILSPVVRELAQATDAFGKTHNGAWPVEASELQSYPMSPEARALSEKTFRKK